MRAHPRLPDLNARHDEEVKMSDRRRAQVRYPSNDAGGHRGKDQASIISTEAGHHWLGSQEAESANQRRGNSFARFQIKSSCYDRSPAARVGHSSVALDAACRRWGMPGVQCSWRVWQNHHDLRGWSCELYAESGSAGLISKQVGESVPVLSL